MKSTRSTSEKPWVESLPVSLLLLSVGMLAFFWCKNLISGMRLNEMAYYYSDYAIAGSFAVVGGMVKIGLKIQKLWDGKWPAELSKSSPSRLNILRGITGMIWASWIFIAPVLAMFLNSFDGTPSNWRVLLGIRATLLVVIPVVCVLPWLRFVRGRPALLVLSFLALGTAFPVLTGLESVIDFIRGPEWQTITVRTFGADELNLVELSDGRTLRYRERVYPALRLGRVQRVLVLRASRYILDAR